MLLSESVAAQLASLDREPELDALRALGDHDKVARELPDDLIDELAAAGTTDQVATSLNALADAGADAIVFVPIGRDPDDQLNLFAKTVAPSLRGAK